MKNVETDSPGWRANKAKFEHVSKILDPSVGVVCLTAGVKDVGFLIMFNYIIVLEMIPVSLPLKPICKQ